MCNKQNLSLSQTLKSNPPFEVRQYKKEVFDKIQQDMEKGNPDGTA